MKKHMLNLVFGLAVLVGIAFFAFEDQLKSVFTEEKDFKIWDVDFYSLGGKKTRVPEGRIGYIVFYADMEGCRSCLNKLGDLGQLSKIYEEVAFYSVLKGDEKREVFLSFLEDKEAPGEYLVDPTMALKKAYNISDHPHLFFFNRHGDLMALMPYDVTQKKLNYTYQQYIEEM